MDKIFNLQVKLVADDDRGRRSDKSLLMVNTEGMILHRTGHKGGRKHDYDVYKHNHPITPSQVENVVDLGYLGIEKDLAF
jgi:hypothetical protein